MTPQPNENSFPPKPSRILRINYNEPVEIALKQMSGAGLIVQGNYGPQVRFNLADGRILYAPEILAEKIRKLAPEPEESFMVCKRKEGRRNVWTVWLTPQSEKRRAEEEIHHDEGVDLTPVLVRSIEAIREAKQPLDIPAPCESSPLLRPTGTEGIQPAPRPMALATAPVNRKPPEKIPVDVALREILGFVTSALSECHEQWTAEAKQDLVSTALIQAAQSGWLTIWKREAA